MTPSGAYPPLGLEGGAPLSPSSRSGAALSCICARPFQAETCLNDASFYHVSSGVLPERAASSFAWLECPYLRLDEDRACCPIDGDPLPRADVCGRPSDSYHCRKAVLAGDNGPVCHRAVDFHHQSDCLEEERRPAGVRGGRDQDFARSKAGLVRIKDHPRQSRHPPRRGRRSLEYPFRLTGLRRVLRLSGRFRPIGEQHQGHPPSSQFPLKGGSPLAHLLRRPPPARAA